MKRDRLRVRNAILKSTGFLEQSAQPIAIVTPGTVVGDGPGDLPGAGIKPSSSLTGSRNLLGGLSQALHAVGSPSVH